MKSLQRARHKARARSAALTSASFATNFDGLVAVTPSHALVGVVTDPTPSLVT